MDTFNWQRIKIKTQQLVTKPDLQKAVIKLLAIALLISLLYFAAKSVLIN